ncbi:MAG: sigma-70 family RNA polymerase sigma factor, partial [Opitutales bacterium]
MSSPPPSPDPWPPVLRRVAAGDAHALRALYEAFAPRLLGLAVRILGSGAEAEEALQDSFVQVWRQARRFDPERASVETWLFLIVRRRCIDRLRRARGQPPRHAFPQEEVLDKLVDFA